MSAAFLYCIFPAPYLCLINKCRNSRLYSFNSPRRVLYNCYSAWALPCSAKNPIRYSFIYTFIYITSFHTDSLYRINGRYARGENEYNCSRQFFSDSSKKRLQTSIKSCIMDARYGRKGGEKHEAIRSSDGAEVISRQRYCAQLRLQSGSFRGQLCPFGETDCFVRCSPCDGIIGSATVLRLVIF